MTAVQDDWNQVKSDAQAVQNAPTGDLDSAWDSFSSAVNGVPNSAGSGRGLGVTQSADQLGHDGAVDGGRGELHFLVRLDGDHPHDLVVVKH